MDELTIYREAACEAARRGAAALASWREKFQVREKGHADLVTDADLASQEAIRGYLLGRFPDHAFLAEEGAAAEHRTTDRLRFPTWIVDPLDGTTNYVHGCPLYCVSIGLEVAGELVVGAVYDPSRDEMFHAARGQGAFLNWRRLKASATDSLGQAMLATGFPPDLRGQERTLDWWRYFSLRTRSLRRTGSTALNLVYVAAGRFDAYYAFDNYVWDVAGGAVVVREAGGVVSNVDGTAYDPYTPDALASNGALHPALLEALRQDPRAG
jgi:myo-inositol-1(or 4)-monophosphatase